MTCPVCGRLYCDHSPSERGQTMEEMLNDIYSPHIIDRDRKTKKVTEREYQDYTGKEFPKIKKSR